MSIDFNFMSIRSSKLCILTKSPLLYYEEKQD